MLYISENYKVQSDEELDLFLKDDCPAYEDKHVDMAKAVISIFYWFNKDAPNKTGLDLLLAINSKIRKFDINTMHGILATVTAGQKTLLECLMDHFTLDDLWYYGL